MHYYSLTYLLTYLLTYNCGNQHYSRELLLMGIVLPETCCAYKKYNKIISSI